jgi:hypothetical protein
MCDHVISNPSAEVHAEGGDGGPVLLRARRPLAAGEALTLTYGPHDNHRLLLSYGFWLPGNPHDRYEFDFDADAVLEAVDAFAGGRGAGKQPTTTPATAASRPADSLASWQTARLGALRLAGPGAQPRVWLGPAGGGPGGAAADGRLLAALRVLLAPGPEALAGAADDALQAWEPLPPGWPPTAEALVVKALVALCTVFYKSFPTTIQADAAALAAADAPLGAPAPPPPASKGFAAAGGKSGGKGGGAAARQAPPAAALSADGRLAVGYRLEAKRSLEATTKRCLARLTELAARQS